MAILRMTEVKAETGYRSHTTIYNLLKEGLFPQPVKISERSNGWPEDEVKAICMAKVAGQSDKQIRQLVSELHELRAHKFKLFWKQLSCDNGLVGA